MTHLLTHGVQDGGCRYTVGLQSCTMCLYGEGGVSRMETLARAGVFFLTLVVYVLVVLAISAMATDGNSDYIPWFAFGLGALAYAVTMTYKWTF